MSANIPFRLDLICKQAQEAKIELRRSSEQKHAPKYAAELVENKAKLIDANTIDMDYY